MKYRKLINTNLELSVIGMGTHQFAGGWGKSFLKSDVQKLLDEANNLGINLLDTAPNYGDHLSEELIGNALLGKRDKWIIATKFGQKVNSNGKNIHDFSADNILNQLNRSLKSLKTDYIDIYQFHSGTNNDFNNVEIWDMLHRQVEMGKIKHLGISMVDAYVKKNDLHQMKTMQNFKANILQVVYNRLNTQPENEIIPYCLKNKIGLIARVPLAKGFLSGKYKTNHSFPSNDIRSSYSAESNYKMLIDVERIKNEELPKNIDMAQWSIAWCLKNNVVSAVIPGAKNIEQLRSNAQASSLVDD